MPLPETVEITTGPFPDEYGNACFVVKIGDRRVEAFATPGGCALRETDFDVSAHVMSAISEFRRGAPEQVRSCLREAARLRRVAGHPTVTSRAAPS